MSLVMSAMFVRRAPRRRLLTCHALPPRCRILILLGLSRIRREEDAKRVRHGKCFISS